MSEETKILTEEVKVKVAERFPPGDRWKPLSNPTVVLESLTDVLEFVYQKDGNTQYYLDASEGSVYVINTEETVVNIPPPPPPKTYSLYGEE